MTPSVNWSGKQLAVKLTEKYYSPLMVYKRLTGILCRVSEIKAASMITK
jgi:hypothetical protein